MAWFMGYRTSLYIISSIYGIHDICRSALEPYFLSFPFEPSRSNLWQFPAICCRCVASVAAWKAPIGGHLSISQVGFFCVRLWLGNVPSRWVTNPFFVWSRRYIIDLTRHARARRQTPIQMFQLENAIGRLSMCKMAMILKKRMQGEWYCSTIYSFKLLRN